MEGEVFVNMKTTSPHTPTTAVFFRINMNDKRIKTFWILELYGCIAFLFWVMFLDHLPRIWSGNSMKISTRELINNTTISTPGFDQSSRNGIKLESGILSDDIWLALAFPASIDAYAVVLNFDRRITTQWHYFVGLRMMALASIVSLAYLLITAENGYHFAPRHPLSILVFCCHLYALASFLVEKFGTTPKVNTKIFYRGSLQMYNKQFSHSDLEVPWSRALVLACTTGLLGIPLTMLVPAAWSTVNPLIQIAFEAIFLNLSGIGRTPRYTVFAFPILLASTFVHWGLKQVKAAPRITISPLAFLALLIAGRVLLDLHLHTMFRNRADLRWARKEVLPSTRILVAIYACLISIEMLGLPVVTYAKLIFIPIFYFFGAAGVVAASAYAIAFEKTEKTEKLRN